MRAWTKRLALLGRMVFGVLTQIAELARAPDLLRQLVMELPFELGNLVLQPLDNLLFHASLEKGPGRLFVTNRHEKPSRPDFRLGRETTGDSSISAILTRPAARRPAMPPPQPAVRVTSRQNPLVTRFRNAARQPTGEGPLLVEGATLLVDEAHRAGWVIEVVAFTENAAG